MSDLSDLLASAEAGEPSAAERVLDVVYDELRRLAAHKLAQEKPGQTLDPTGLVHEAYLRLMGPPGLAHFQSRQHFFGAAAEAMRRILIENARRKGREKRGGGRKREQTNLDELSANASPEELLFLHDALDRLALHDPT